MAGFLTLDLRGIVLAVVMGILILLLGGNEGLLFLGVLLLFLILSALVTGIGRHRKLGIGVYENQRGWKNVLANGLVPLAVAFIYYVSLSAGALPQAVIAAVYVTSVAAVTADKFASEIGVLDGEPVMLLTLKTVKKGTSGAITALGTGASAIAALIIGASLLITGGGLWIFAIISVSGFLGGIVDSALGYYEEKGIGNKYTSNFLCAVAASIICLLALVF